MQHYLEIKIPESIRYWRVALIGAPSKNWWIVQATNAKAAKAKIVFKGRNAPVNPIRAKDLKAVEINALEANLDSICNFINKSFDEIEAKAVYRSAVTGRLENSKCCLKDKKKKGSKDYRYLADMKEEREAKKESRTRRH